MKPYCTYFWILIFSVLTAQEETVSKIYWNSLSTAVNVGVPLADDESLRGGRIQIRVSFDDGENFLDIADPFEIEKRDIDDLKEVSISAEIFESMPGFQENGEAQFIAEIWDKAGNSIVGSVSDSILTIDETVPTLVSLKVISSNAFDSSLAMPNDSITFDLITSEPIKHPVFEINNDDFEPVGFEKSWKTVYYADDADDGIISFIIQYFDLAGNPSQPITMASNNKSITKAIISLVEENKFELVETFAEKIAEMVIKEYKVKWIKLRVSKPGALRFSKDVGVIIERNSKSYE